MINLQKARMKLEKACENMSNKVDQQLKKIGIQSCSNSRSKSRVYTGKQPFSSKFITYREI